MKKIMMIILGIAAFLTSQSYSGIKTEAYVLNQAIDAALKVYAATGDLNTSIMTAEKHYRAGLQKIGSYSEFELEQKAKEGAQYAEKFIRRYALELEPGCTKAELRIKPYLE